MVTTITTPREDRTDASAPLGRERWAARVERAVAELEAVVGELEPERCDAEGALRLLALFARGRKATAAGESLAARRVDECGAHRRVGHRSTAHLVAEVGGTSVGRAMEVVETGKRLRDHTATDEALRAGAVSLEQAHAVTKAAEADPSAEEDLLVCAQRESLRRLTERARDVRLAAEEDRLGRYRRQRAARSLRHGRDDDGMVWGQFRLPPDAGAAVINRLERQADREYRAERRKATSEATGGGERHDRYLADALVTLCTAGGDDRRGARRADVVVHVSYEALRRGTVRDGERCSVQGGGPVPVEVARDLLGDGAFLKGVLVDGTDVVKVEHFGRHRPADLQTALDARSVLVDDDVTCSAEGCDRRLGLEWDHDRPHADGGATSYDNLRPLCRIHHRTKSDHDRRRRPSRAGPDPP